MSYPPTTASYPSKIIALWTTFLLATLFHTQLALMPLFHSIDVAESHTHELARLDVVFWLMWLFFLGPLLAILGTVFQPSRRFRSIHFYGTILYSFLNLAHFIADLLVHAPSYQLSLMAFLIIIGIALNLVSYRWMQDARSLFLHHPQSL